MAPQSVGRSLGLPAAALAVMVGIVFIVNAHRYGAVGIGGGVVLCLAGVSLAVVSFRPKRN